MRQEEAHMPRACRASAQDMRMLDVQHAHRTLGQHTERVQKEWAGHAVKAHAPDITVMTKLASKTARANRTEPTPTCSVEVFSVWRSDADISRRGHQRSQREETPERDLDARTQRAELGPLGVHKQIEQRSVLDAHRAGSALAERRRGREGLSSPADGLAALDACEPRAVVCILLGPDKASHGKAANRVCETTIQWCSARLRSEDGRGDVGCGMKTAPSERSTSCSALNGRLSRVSAAKRPGLAKRRLRLSAAATPRSSSFGASDGKQSRVLCRQSHATFRMTMYSEDPAARMRPLHQFSLPKRAMPFLYRLGGIAISPTKWQRHASTASKAIAVTAGLRHVSTGHGSERRKN